MSPLRDWFIQQRDILLSRYQLPSIRGICPAFDSIDSMANTLDLRIEMKCLSSELLNILQKIQNHIRYGALPIPDQPTTPYLDKRMNSLEAKLDLVEVEVEDMSDELLSKPAGGEE